MGKTLPRVGKGVLFLAAWLAAGAAWGQEAPRDAWWARDKAMHLGVGLMLPTAGWAASGLVLDSPEQRLVFGGALGLTAGVAKELYDLGPGPGTPSVRDLAWSAAGTAVGLGFTWALDRLVFAPQRTARRLHARRVDAVAAHVLMHLPLPPAPERPRLQPGRLPADAPVRDPDAPEELDL